MGLLPPRAQGEEAGRQIEQPHHLNDWSRILLYDVHWAEQRALFVSFFFWLKLDIKRNERLDEIAHRKNNVPHDRHVDWG
jgi:hypothetical protein